jgi:DNA repair exonuclease SbcCD ATPase subunit
MVSLEQIHALEARVEKAVLLIEKLRKENAELEQRLVEASLGDERLREAEQKYSAAALKATEADERAAALDKKAQAAEAENTALRERVAQAEQKAVEFEAKAAEFEAKAEQLKHEQSRIEEGLSHALDKLDAFEDLVMGISLSETTHADASLPGDEKVEAVELSPSAPVSQEEPFRNSENSSPEVDGDTAGTKPDGADESFGLRRGGPENELDIF